MQYISAGVAIGDYDGDGWEDLYFTNAWDIGLEYLAPPHSYDLTLLEPRDVLYRNEGDGTFADVTLDAGLGDRWASSGAAFADYDGDHDLDLTLSGYGLLRLYRNNGNGTFTEVGGSVGVGSEGKCGSKPCWSTSVSWADPDHDEDLDLYVTNYVELDLGVSTIMANPGFYPFQPNLYFRNKGDGSFEEVAKDLGIHDPDGHGFLPLWVDVDNDGWEDLFISNDFSANSLYRNNGDGTFTDISEEAGIAVAESSMGVAAGDFDLDGDEDLLTTQYMDVETQVFINDGTGHFTYVKGSDLGLGSSTALVGWGSEFFDVDLDGDLDLFIVNGHIGEGVQGDQPNLLYEWRGDGVFHEVTDQAGDFRGNRSTRAAGMIDYDHDGDEDIVAANVGEAPAHLMRNEVQRKGSWLHLELKQPEGNTMALGAKVRVQPLAQGMKPLTKEVRAGTSYETGNSRFLAWGLGPASEALVTVTWPGGAQDGFTLQSEHAWLIERGAAPRMLR